MATSVIKNTNAKLSKQVIGVSDGGDYSDTKILKVLHDSYKIINYETHAFEVSGFNGGNRTGFCNLYGDKDYGWVMVFHYNSAPRFFTVAGGYIALRSFASS